MNNRTIIMIAMVAVVMMMGQASAAQPVIEGVNIPNSAMKVDDVITATITVTSDVGTHTLTSGTIGGFTLGGLSKVSDTSYTAVFTIANGGTDVAAGAVVPVANLVMTDGTTPSATYAADITQDSDAIDANLPTISAVAIPNAAMKVGDVVTATITVGDDGGDAYTLTSGTIGGFALGSLARTDSTTYTATFTIANGGTDVAAGAVVPVANLVMADSATNPSATYAADITQDSDAIDANLPTISAVAIPNAAMKVGDVVTATITVGDDGGDAYTLTSGTIGGFALGSLARTESTTYTATFTIANGGTDVAAGAVVPVANLVMADSATNPSATYAADITQDSDAIDANLPTISSAARDTDTQITVTLSESVADPTADNTGGFTVTETGGVATYAVSAIADVGGSAELVVLTVADMSASSAAGVTVTYTAGGDGLIVDTSTNALATDGTGVPVAAWGATGGIITVSTIEQPIVAGKGNQALALITITDTSTSHALGGTTRLAAPTGVTFNTSASIDMTVTATGTLDCTGYTLTSTLLTVTHTKSSDQNNALRISGLVIDTAANVLADADGVTDLGTPDNVKITYAIGSLSATKLLKVYKPDIAQTASSISAGGTGESLSNLIITTNGAAGQIGNNTNIMVYAPTSKGIMFDESQTITVSGTAGRVNATAAVVASGSITLPVIADWSAGNAITIEGIKVNTTAAAENGALTVNVTAASPSTGVVQADVDAVADISIQKPTFIFAANSEVIVGGNGQTIASTLTIESTTAGDLTTGGDVATDTGWINLTINRTDVTFDKSVDSAANQDWEDALLDITGNYRTDGEFVEGDVIVTDDKLAINLTLDGAAAATDSIVLNGLKVNVSETVEDGAVFRFDITTTPSAGLEIEGATAHVVTAEKPTITTPTSVDIAIGASGSALSGDLVIDSEIAGDLTAGNDLAGATGWINLTLNNTDVTFDKSVDADGIVWEAALLDLPDHDDVVDADVIVTDDKLAIKLTLTTGAAADDVVTIDLSQVQLNVTADKTLDDNSILFHVNTTPETGSNVRVDSNAAAKLVLPTLTFTESTISVDADYINGTAIHSITVTAEAADAADIYPGADAWVNLTITGGSGVTFDKSDAYADVTAGDATTTAGTFVITDTKVAVQVTAVGGANTVIFTPTVNATAGATNTTLSVETNPGGVSITQDLTNQIIVGELEPTAVTGNANIVGDGIINVGDHGETGEAEAKADVTVGTTTTGSVYVAPSGVSAGNVDVILAIVEAPAGATGYALDESSITTGPDDIAYFNFTAGDLVGDYIVNATLPGVAGGVNMTYTATAGTVNGISVTPIENAIAGLSGDAGNATLWVNLTDIYGNPVGAGAATTLTVGDSGHATVSAYDTLTAEGEGSGAGPTLVGSTLTIDGDGSSVIELTNTVAESVDVTVEYSGHSDTGTVIFYGPIVTIALELSDSEVVVGESVTANATIKQADGTVIEVPDVAMVFDDNTDANTSFVAPSADVTTITVNTNEDGVASATVRADQVGTSTLDASTSLKKGSAVLTINQPTLSLSLNATYVAVGVETPVLATVVFQHNGTKAEGVTINMTGAGVTVAEQDTDANGNATCTVNATSAGTITVNATKTGCVAAAATVTAGAAPTIDTITVAPAGPLTMNTTETQTFIATCYNDSTEVTGITVVWASSNETVGTITSSGVFTADVNGTTTITAAAQGVTSSAVTVTVGAATGLPKTGDIDGSGSVDFNDAVHLAYYTIYGSSSYPLHADGDVDSSGSVDFNDAVYLAYYTIYGSSSYPLYP